MGPTGKTDRRLTKKEETFCQGLIAGLNGADAYRKAYGVGPVPWARIQAHKIAARAHVIARLAELRAPAEKAKFLTIQRKREMLYEMANDVKATKIDRQRAIDLDNRMTGVYTSKVEVTGEITLGAVLSALSSQPGLPDASEVYELKEGDVKITAAGTLEASPESAGGLIPANSGPFADDLGTDAPPEPVKAVKTGLVKPRKRVYAD